MNFYDDDKPTGSCVDCGAVGDWAYAWCDDCIVEVDESHDYNGETP